MNETAAKTDEIGSSAVPAVESKGTTAANSSETPEEMKVFHANERERFSPRTGRNHNRGYGRW